MGIILGQHTAQMSLLVFFVAILVTGTTALLCYNCDNIEDNSQCVNVTHCPPGEVCYATSDGLSTGKVIHRTGCTVHQELPDSGTPGRFTFCTQQCSEHLCNMGKCSSVVNMTRGPHCLSCDLVPSVDDCTNVTQCRDNEMCYFQKFTTFGNIRYRMGCVEKEHCQAVRNQPVVVGKRTTSSNDCFLCCDTDNCNSLSCSSLATGVEMYYTFNATDSEPDCDDFDPAMCSLFGLFNTDACIEPLVSAKCPKSCGTCEHVIWSTWGQWSSCSTTCGPGTRHRSRDCLSIFNVTQQNYCTGPVTRSGPCNVRHCPIDGGWSQPDKFCLQYCIHPSAQYGGKPCS